MPIPGSLVGTTAPPVEHIVDERWTMAYAAALGCEDACYFDTQRPDGIVAHPLFPVCLEWPIIVSQRAGSEDHGVTRQEVLTGIHATHDVTIHRLVRPGDVLTTSLEIVGVVDIKPGAKATTRMETVDPSGEPVASTTQDAIYLGVPTDGANHPDPTPPAPINGSERVGDPIEVPIKIEAGAAHVYTECARIWNPIHTDVSVAKASGLPDIILHGTANLAHGVSAVVATCADGRPEMVRRIAGRFAAMVRLPSTITVRVWPANETEGGRSTVPFEVLNDAGDPAVANGVIVLGPC